MASDPQAFAQVGDFGRTVEVVFIDRDRESRETWVASFEDGQVEPIFSRQEEGVIAKPTMRISPTLARSLYMALGPIVAGDALRHDHARQDYLHERGRLDKILDLWAEHLRSDR
jgi:hypothetical protein